MHGQKVGGRRRPASLIVLPPVSKPVIHQGGIDPPATPRGFLALTLPPVLVLLVLLHGGGVSVPAVPSDRPTETRVLSRSRPGPPRRGMHGGRARRGSRWGRRHGHRRRRRRRHHIGPLPHKACQRRRSKTTITTTPTNRYDDADMTAKVGHRTRRTRPASRAVPAMRRPTTPRWFPSRSTTSPGT
jgi:hypothetical protein